MSVAYVIFTVSADTKLNLKESQKTRKITWPYLRDEENSSGNSYINHTCRHGNIIQYIWKKKEWFGFLNINLCGLFNDKIILAEE